MNTRTHWTTSCFVVKCYHWTSAFNKRQTRVRTIWPKFRRLLLSRLTLMNNIVDLHYHTIPNIVAIWRIFKVCAFLHVHFVLDHVFFVLVNFWNYDEIKTLLLMPDIYHTCLHSSTPSVPWNMSPFKVSFKKKKYRSNVEGKPYERNWVTTLRALTCMHQTLNVPSFSLIRAPFVFKSI